MRKNDFRLFLDKRRNGDNIAALRQRVIDTFPLGEFFNIHAGRKNHRALFGIGIGQSLLGGNPNTVNASLPSCKPYGLAVTRGL